MIKKKHILTDVVIYLQDSANIRYSVSTSYNVTVTCQDSDGASITSYLLINVDQNLAPVFSNFQGTVANFVNKYMCYTVT